MANIASVLKEEIIRLARKELKSETESVKKASARYRSEIAALKRRLVLLEKQVATLEKRPAGRAAVAPQIAATDNVRFSATGLKKLRARQELSAPILATILGVSAQTIYNWEAGTTRPSKDQIGKIALLRKMTKREIQAGLARMQAA